MGASQVIQDETDVDAPPSKTERLIMSLSITEDDLDLNAEGKLSPAQLKHLKIDRENHTWQIFAAGIGVLSMIFNLIRESGRASESFFDNPVVILLVIVILIIGAVLAVRKRNEVKADINAGLVKRLDGPVQAALPRRWWTYTVVSNDIQLQVPRRTFKAFTFGERYTIYYVPRTMKVVGVEPLL
jgi:hypothetical protein